MFLDNLYKPKSYPVLNEQYLVDNDIELTEDLYYYICENYEILQGLLDRGYDIVRFLNERTIFTYSPKNPMLTAKNFLSSFSSPEEKLKAEKFLRHFAKRDAIAQHKVFPKNGGSIYDGMSKSGLRTDPFSLAYVDQASDKLGINKDMFKRAYSWKKEKINPLLNKRKQQIKDRLWKSDKFKNLSKEEQNKLLAKVDRKSFGVSGQNLFKHELEHINQGNIIMQLLGVKGKLKASNNYQKQAAKSAEGYVTAPFEYGANLAAAGKLNPQLSKELALHQVDPKKYPLKSIKIDLKKALELHDKSNYVLKDQRRRTFDIADKYNNLQKRISMRERINNRSKPFKSFRLQQPIRIRSKRSWR